MAHREGWIPDRPDHRDLIASPSLRGSRKKAGALPTSIDLREHDSPIEQQGAIGSCTSHAVVGLVEHLQRRVHKKHLDASRLFLYKVTRRLLGWKGDTGAHLRTTLKALVLFGVPPEHEWPYREEDFEKEPDTFIYAQASNFKALKYFRVDTRKRTAQETLVEVKHALAAGHPLAFGFTTYSSLGDGPDIPFPTAADRADGGHAVMAVGYDDAHKVGKGQDRGALLIRNSWGREWGDKGYGWLPYKYLEEGLAEDFWALTDAAHVDLRAFE